MWQVLEGKIGEISQRELFYIRRYYQATNNRGCTVTGQKIRTPYVGAVKEELERFD